jgi:hypothetical protein
MIVLGVLAEIVGSQPNPMFPVIIWQQNVASVNMPLRKHEPYFDQQFAGRVGYLVDPRNMVTDRMLALINKQDEWSNRTVFYNLLFPYLHIGVVHHFRAGSSVINLMLNTELVVRHFVNGQLPPSFFYTPIMLDYVNTFHNKLTVRVTDNVLPRALLEGRLLSDINPSQTPLFAHQRDGLAWALALENKISEGLPVGRLRYQIPFSEPIAGRAGGVFWDPVAHSLALCADENASVPLYACGGMIGDGIGSGKTLQMLSLIVHDLQLGRTSQSAGAAACGDSKVAERPMEGVVQLKSRATLVVCGKQLAEQWRQQVREHFGHLHLNVIVITDKLHHERLTSQNLLHADLIIVTMSFFCGVYYREQFLGQRILPDIAPLNRYYGYLMTLQKTSAPVLEQIKYRRIILDEADMYLHKLPYADPGLEHQYQRRLSQHARVNCSRKTEPFIYLQCLSADYRWIVTSTANFSDPAQQAAFVSFLGLGLGSADSVDYRGLHQTNSLSTPRTVQLVQPLTLDRALVGPSALEHILVKEAFLQHLLLSRSQEYVFGSMSLPPLDTEVIWIEYSAAERNLVQGALEMDSDYNFRRHVHAFPLQVTQTSEEAEDVRAMSVQDAGEVMMGAQRRRLIDLESSMEQLRSNLQEVDCVIQTATDVLVNMLNHRHLQITNELRTTEQTVSAIQRSMRFLEASLNSKDPCTICMDAPTTVITRCGHKFCIHCLQRSLQERPRCPSCRSPCAWEQCIPLLSPVAVSEPGIDYGSRFRALLQYLTTARSSHPEAQFLVFSEWDRELHKQATLLRGEGFRCAQIKGNTSTCQTHVREFQDQELDVLFLSLQSMASGLHLVTANHVIILTPLGAPFDRADQVERQAIGRCHRVGQRLPVHVRHILVRGSLEEEIWKARHGSVEVE